MILHALQNSAVPIGMLYSNKMTRFLYILRRRIPWKTPIMIQLKEVRQNSLYRDRGKPKNLIQDILHQSTNTNSLPMEQSDIAAPVSSAVKWGESRLYSSASPSVIKNITKGNPVFNPVPLRVYS